MANKMKTSEYLEAEARSFSIYVLTDRSLAYFSDGLKPAARRILWTARNGEKYGSASLGGLVMNLHPHGIPESSINTLAAKYLNNIRYLEGFGAFGTRITPSDAFGALRYTKVKISKFTKDVMFRDIEIVPMQDNYDNSCQEPVHFLPLVASVCVNPQSGIGVGFACDILGRDLENIINNQISHLEGKDFRNPKPCLIPLDQYSTGLEEDKKGKERWMFNGEIEVLNKSEVLIKNIPYGIEYDSVIKKLDALEEADKINGYEDSSKDQFKIKVIFKRGMIEEICKDNLLKYLGLINGVTENFTIIDATGVKVLETDYITYVKAFTDWRLGWYVKRYEREKTIAEAELQKFLDIITAINKNLGSIARTCENRTKLKEKCQEFGIINIEYIADLPTYRYTEKEKNSALEKIKELKEHIALCIKIINSEKMQKEIYIQELTEIKNNYKKGLYK